MPTLAEIRAQRTATVTPLPETPAVVAPAPVVVEKKPTRKPDPWRPPGAKPANSSMSWDADTKQYTVPGDIGSLMDTGLTEQEAEDKLKAWKQPAVPTPVVARPGYAELKALNPMATDAELRAELRGKEIPTPEPTSAELFAAPAPIATKEVGLTGVVGAKEQTVRRAAMRADVRARAEQLVKSEGLRGILGFDKDASNEDIRQSLSAADPDSVLQEHARWLESKFDAEGGTKLADMPPEVRAREVQKIREKAAMDLALLRTVGAFGPKSLSLATRDPNSVLDALKPTADVIGLDENGVPVVRSQSAGGYAMQALSVPAYMAVATGAPSVAAKAVFGAADDARGYEQDRAIDPESIRERREFSNVITEETAPGDTTKRIAKAVVPAVYGALGKDAPDEVVEKAGKALSESVAGKVIDTGMTAAAVGAGALTDVFFPDTFTAVVGPLAYAGKLAKVRSLGKLDRAVVAVDGVADASASARDSFAGLIRAGAGKDEVDQAIKAADVAYTKASGKLAQTAKDAIEDAARVRTQAEMGARQSDQGIAQASKTGDAVQLGSTKMDGVLADAVAAERLASYLPGAQNPALGLTEGLHRVQRLLAKDKLTPVQAAAYAERLFDSAAETAQKLSAGAKGPTPPPSAARALADVIELVPAPNASPVQAAVRAKLVRELDAIGKMRASSPSPKALAKLAERELRAVEKAVTDGLVMLPSERTAWKSSVVASIEPHLVGDDPAERLKRAADLLNAAITRSYTGGGVVNGDMLAALDGILRANSVEAAETARRVSPLVGAAKDILTGESAARARAIHGNPAWTVKRVLTKGMDAIKVLFIGGNELAPWAKDGLSAEARRWTLNAARAMDAVASDVGKLESVDDAVKYLEGQASTKAAGLLTTGQDRIGIFLHHVELSNDDITAYIDALLQPPIGRPEYDLARKAALIGEIRDGIATARSGTMSVDELIAYIHSKVEPFTQPNAPTEGWLRVTTGWIAGHAENTALLDAGFGDGIVFTAADKDAIEALAGGKWSMSWDERANPASVVDRAVAARRMVGPGALAKRTEEGIDIGGVVPVTVSGDFAAKLFTNTMAREIYVPRKVREEMVKALARTYTPATAVGNSALAWWKLAVTRGAISSKPGYLVNNIPGDFEQVWVAFGYDAAIKTAIRSEGATLAGLLTTGGPGRLVGLAIPGPAGALAGGLVEMGLGTLSATLIGKNKGALTAILNTSGDVGERAARALSKIIDTGSFRIEISKILDGGTESIRVGDQFWTARELREVAIKNGVFDGFDKAELAPHVAALGKKFSLPAEGVQHLAETIGLRRRLGLYVTLIEDGVTPVEAAKGVNKALFDYRAILSDTEKFSGSFLGWLREVLLPFWSWQKSMNRLVLGSVTSPLGAYRIKQATAASRVAEHYGNERDWLTGTPASDGDDIGILTTYMLTPDMPSYERWKAYRSAIEKAEGGIPPEKWNALWLKSNASIPATITWARDPKVPKELWLSDTDITKLRGYVSPWYTPEMARSYLHERAQVRMGKAAPASNMGDGGEYWHVVAPKDGVAGAAHWFGQIAAGLSSAIGGQGTVAEQLVELSDPTRAPILGTLYAMAQPAGRPPEKISQAFASFLMSCGIPGVRATDRRGVVEYEVSPALAASIANSPGAADLNRNLLATEGKKGGNYRPDALRLTLGGYGLATPTVSPDDAAMEGDLRKKATETQVSGLRIARDEAGAAVVR